MKERWKWIRGCRGRFKISTRGRVRSYRNGKIKLRKLCEQTNGYIYLRLRRFGKVRNCRVHRLVLEAFVGPCPPGKEARHFPDDDKANNYLENLSYASKKKNQKDKRLHGTATIGEDHPGAKLETVEVLAIRRRLNEGRTCLSLACSFKVSEQAIRDIKLGRTWKCLKKEPWILKGNEWMAKA